MFLAKPDDVVSALGVASSVGLVDKARSALYAALPILETVLETRLIPGMAFDKFTIPAVPTSVMGSYAYVLRLGCRFPDVETITVSHVETGESITVSAGSVDRDLGLLAIPADSLRGRTGVLLVSYEFGAELGAQKVWDYPTWIQQAAITAALMTLNTQPTTPANRKDKTVFNAAAALHGMVRQQTHAYDRPRASVVWPFYSTVSYD